ncbi:hypothetical protein H5410_027305 [Solanum commersonii]|uniref:Uncharacterized protein n=1 Tax=Solanum commersonii TaxID=4109 RepID=A0A9J5Z0X9_SOLCO|nr:hypothetical protein H5410_027305 [Solanum commersonii]
MLETLRSKSEKDIRQTFTSMGSVKGNCSAAYSDRNELASDKNLVQPCLDLIEDETSFPHENLDVMQETARSKPAKEKGQNFTSVCSSKESKNLMLPGFDPIEVDTLISYDDLEVMGRGKGFTSLSSVGGSVEKRKMIGNNKEKDIRQTFTSMGSVKGSIVVQGTSIEKSKDCSAAYSDRNELASDKNLVQPCLDLIEDETSFPHENLDVMQRNAGNNGDEEKGLHLGFVRGVEKKKMIGNNKGLNSQAYDQNIVAKKTNVVPPYFDAIECDTSFPHDNHEVMQDTLRRKSGKVNREIFTSVDSGRGSTFQQRTSIRTSKGYSAVSSYTNVLAHNKNLRQPDFSQIEHDTAFPHDDLEVMQQDLRSKSARERAQSFTSMDSMRRCAEKRTLNGQSKDSENAEYELDELAQNNNCVLSGLDPMEDNPTLRRDEVEVMQDNQRRKTGSCEFEKVKKVRGPNLCKEKFDSDDMNGHRDHVLKHMRRLWNNWRGSMHMNVKSKPLKKVLKDVPQGVDKSDWEWLVKEHFLTEKFKGGKHGNPPDMATIFFETCKKDNKLLEPETNKKYDEIQELLQVEPSLTNIEVVERCFGPQSKSHVVGFGGGITSKDLKGGSTTKIAFVRRAKSVERKRLHY